MNDKLKNKLKNKRPPYILLTYDSMAEVARLYSEEKEAIDGFEKYRNLTISNGITLIVSAISVIAAFKAMGIIECIFISVLGLILFVYTCVGGIECWKAYRKKKKYKISRYTLEERLLHESQEKCTRYTGIIRLNYINNYGIQKYLVGLDYYLPHCDLNSDYSIENQKQMKIIADCLKKDFKIQGKHIIKIVPVNDEVHYCIKPVKNEVKLNCYVFFDIYISLDAKKALVEECKKWNWMSIDDMKINKDAVAKNNDVISILDQLNPPDNSFVNLLGDFNIIWNISSQCAHNCAICATYDQERKELSTNNKLKVLNNIATAGRYIKSLDFAGGDPLYTDANGDTLTIIQSALKQLGSDKVSITTTGTGVSKYDELQDKLTEIQHCEITIDAAHSSFRDGVISRKEERYCKSNLEQIDQLLEHADSLTVNIPIINDDLTDEEIEELVNNVSAIHRRNPSVEIDALLIRLMPVGRLTDSVSKEEYGKYNPIVTAKKIMEKLVKAGIDCRPHCSFRVLPVFNNGVSQDHCSMMENKMGIDCAGNVFACAWGAYLSGYKKLSDNPFYLGNLTNTKLKDIIENRSKTKAYKAIYRNIQNQQQRFYCSVVSCFATGDPFENSDYLAFEISEVTTSHQ